MAIENKENLLSRVEFFARKRLHGKSEPEIERELQKTYDSVKKGPSTYQEYKDAPMEVQTYWEFAHSKQVDAVLDAHKDEQKKAAQKKDANISRMWTGQTSEEETAKCKATAEEFLSRYRHFLRVPENSGAMADRMRDKNLSPHDLSSFVRAFEELAVEGRLVLSGKIAGICDDEMVGGHALRTHKELHRFLQPTPTAEQLERLAAARMSADEWKKSRPELQDGLPFVARQQIYQAIRSLAHFEPDYVFTDANNEKLLQYVNKNKLQFNLTGLRTAYHAIKDQLELKPHTVSGQVVQMTVYDAPENQGEPLAPEKLRAKIRNMSSDEMLLFFRDNPSARKAVDAVGQ